MLSGLFEDELLHDDFSVSVCEVIRDSSYLLTYIGSSTAGSSGGPLVNEFGKILGVNFGYYYDT
jgi:S1-C subfamily serine protease